MIRLLVSDVDGTLVNKDKQLTEATIAATGRLREAGIGFTVISARPRSGLMPLLDQLALDAPVGAFNGGLVFTRDGRELFHDTVEPEVAGGCLALAVGMPVDIWVFADDRWYASSEDGEHVEHERIASNQEPVIRTDFADLAARADKITFVSDEPHVLADLHARIDRAFAGRATVGLSQTYYLDVTSLAANKGAGIAVLADALGVPLSETAAIGDQHNDRSMLARVALPVVMGNAPADMREGAAHLTRGNDQDGVAHAIDTIIFPATGVRT
jgi:Cof subfamily protein (haloacid dehalogenase superfamily)